MNDLLPSWHDTPTRQAILDFVGAVTDETSPQYVPQADRIAVFDNDGTLWCEKPTYIQMVLVAVLAVLPSFVPLLLFYNNPDFAIRASNVVSFIVLFISGYQWGKYAGSNPWRTGLLLASIAALMVLIAFLLGG